MDNLKVKYDQMVQMLERLKRAIFVYNQRDILTFPDQYQVDVILGLRGLVIKDFELCVDHIWKYMKVFLEEEHAQVIDVASPSNIVRHALKVNLLNPDDTEAIIAMIKVRNKTSHIYKEEIADITADQAHRYCSLMEQVLEKMKPTE